MAHHAYNINIFDGGLESRFLQTLQQLQPKGAVIPIISDENVFDAYHKLIIPAIIQYGAKPEIIVIKPGEASKSLKNYGLISELLIKMGVERNSLIIALGGGVVGDLAGFVASTLLRGVRFVQIPTSLLAMVDSSVGGKTAVNSRYGKNMIGAFHQPSAVLMDIQVLKTLPAPEFSAGMAEIIKYGMIMDSEFFAYLESNIDGILSHDPAILTKIIGHSVACKARIVEQDEREGGIRAILNFGHTFGHALERHYNYKILHGHSVALGMVLASQFAQLPNDQLQRLVNLCGRFSLPVQFNQMPAGKLFNPRSLCHYMMNDKKVENQKITLILPNKIGAVDIVKNVETADIISFYKKTLAYEK